MDKLVLCEKCGYFMATFDLNMKDCPVCKNKLITIGWDECPAKQFFHMSTYEKEQFAISYIGHDFDPNLKDERIYYLANKKKVNQNNKTQSSTPKPTCPTCSSTNVSKISAMSKAVSVGLWGIFSQKVKRQFKCGNCGYEW